MNDFHTEQIVRLTQQVGDLRAAVLMTCTFAMKAATLAANDDPDRAKEIISEMKSILDEIHAKLRSPSEGSNG